MILQIDNLSFSYNGRQPVFQNVSFSLAKGQIMSILGVNGAGKSTLLNCIANLLAPSAGHIMLEGQPMDRMKLQQVARFIGYVPQSHTPAYSYEVKDFVVMGRAPHLGPFQQPAKEDEELVEQALENLGISHLKHRSYTELSGGEQQQVMIARVIVQQPKLILLDEPTNHLDYGNQLRMLDRIRYLAEEGYGIILTSHMPDHVIMLGGTVGVLDNEGNLTVGNVEETITEKGLRQLYQSNLHLIYVDRVARKVCIPG